MNYSSPHTQTGFTLIELLVTISIVILVTGIALARYASFNSTVLLNNEAYEVALDIRRAQAYGLSASGFGGDYRAPYGICFDRREPGQYVFFQDTSGDGRCSGGEVLETISVDSRFQINQLCADTTCRLVRDDRSGSMSILFERPNFRAKLWSSWDGNPTSVTIRLVPARDRSAATRSIVVESTGYISVQSE